MQDAARLLLGAAKGYVPRPQLHVALRRAEGVEHLDVHREEVAQGEGDVRPMVAVVAVGGRLALDRRAVDALERVIDRVEDVEVARLVP